MLHPIDYRLSKNKFWLSTWNSYSLKNYKNLILNDKILNVLGYIFKNCFKVSYSFASPWSNPRKYRKYFSNFIIGFDGRRAIRTGPNKVKKLPGFIIPEDYNIIRFNNFSILKIYFLIDKNLETYWTKKQKNWRSPLKYFNMRYNKNRNTEDNLLKLNKNLVINNIEKKNFKITSFFIYLINLINNNSIKQHLYLNVSEQINFFKKDKKPLYLKFYYDNNKLLNKIRNNYFLFYLVNKSNKNTFNKLNLLKNNNIFTINNSLNTIYFKNRDVFKKPAHKNNKNIKCNNFLPKINYKDLLKYKNFNISNKKPFNYLYSFKYLLRNNINTRQINMVNNKQYFFTGVQKYIIFNKIKNKNKGLYITKNFIKKNIRRNFLNTNKKTTFYNINNTNIIFNNFYFNTNRKTGVGLFFQNNNLFNFNSNKLPLIYLRYKKFYNIFKKNYKNLNIYKKNWELSLLKNNNIVASSNYFNFLYNKQSYNNYKYFLLFLKNKFFLNNSNILNKINYFKKSFKNKSDTKERVKNFKIYFDYRLNIKFLLYLNKKVKFKSYSKFRYSIKKKNYKFLTNTIIKKKSLNLFSKNKKLLLVKKNIYFNFNSSNSFISNKIITKKNFFLSEKKKKLLNKYNWGKIFWSINNFKKKKYLYYVKNNVEFNSRYLQKPIVNKILEYNMFKKIKNFYNKGNNFYLNKNLNFNNSVFNIYSSDFLNKLLLSSNLIYNSNEINNSFENVFFLKNYVKNKNRNNNIKNFKTFNLLNLYYKKTFSKFIKKQEDFGKENFDRINYRLENLNKNKYIKLYKFKPYSLKSISKSHSNRLYQFVLTNYLYNNIKKKYIFDFLNSMENKKYTLSKNFFFLLKAQGTLLLNNISLNKFQELKSLNYAFNSFNKKIKILLSFNKKIKNKDSSFFLYKKKATNFLLNHITLINEKKKYHTHLQKFKFYYFKSQKNQKTPNKGSSSIYIKPFNSLLYSNYFSLNNNNNNLKLKLHKHIKYFYKNIKNHYKYKLNIYNYFKINKSIDLKQFYLPLNFNNKKFSIIVPLILKKNNVLKKKNHIYTKSNNLLINRYIKTRLFNVFFSKKHIHKAKKINKLKSENFNYRIYGLVKKLSDLKLLNKKDFKKINLLKPRTFLYWRHLKWFNIFVKTKFNFKFNTFYNSYSVFKLYENYKNLNFYHYKNNKKSYNKIYYNPFSSFKYGYQKLNILVFYSTVFKIRKNILLVSSLNRVSHKKMLLLNWTQDIMFSSSYTKRLNYIPHMRFKPIKDSIFMWRIHLRKFNLLSKYYKARAKFYKNKLNFVSNYNTRTNIVNYLKVMESNFLRIKKTMQRELPLIHTKRYLLTQLKKLNNYIKVLLRRHKKRLNYSLKQKIKFVYNSKTLLKENKILSKNLFIFVTKRFFLGKKNFIDYVKNFIEHLFFVIFKFNNLRLFYIKKYQINIMSTKAKLFKNLFNYRLATGFKIPFLVKVICKKLNFDKSLVGCKIGFFGRYSKKLRNRKIWRYVKHLKPSVISTPIDYYNILILQKWGITGIKLSMLKKKTFNFIFTQ